MELENKIMKFYNEGVLKFKDDKIIRLLKVVLVEKEDDIDKIINKVYITVPTIKKYLREKDGIRQFLSESEFQMFETKMNYIINSDKEKNRQLELKLIAKIIDEIYNTRHKIDNICANNFFPRNKFNTILLKSNYIDENFGDGVQLKVKAKINENRLKRESVPRHMYLIEDRCDVFVAKDDIHCLNEYDFRRLSFARDYLCSGANIDYVINKYETNIATVISILSDPKLKEILKSNHYQDLKRYIEVEINLLNNNLSYKKNLLFNIIKYLYQNNFDINDALNYFKLPEFLFNKLLIEVTKSPYFDEEVKQGIKTLLTPKEEKKVK